MEMLDEQAQPSLRVFYEPHLGLHAGEASTSPMGLLYPLSQSDWHPASELAGPASTLATMKKKT